MRLRLLLCGLWFCVMTGTAQAVPITFTLGSSLITTLPGLSVTFTGTLAETGGTTTFLNGDSFSSALPADDTPFFLNFPIALSPLQSVTAAVFRVIVPAATPPGLYSGTFSVLGGSTPAAFNVLASQQFAVSVTPAAVPEPGPAWLLLFGGSATAIFNAARRRLWQ